MKNLIKIVTLGALVTVGAARHEKTLDAPATLVQVDVKEFAPLLRQFNPKIISIIPNGSPMKRRKTTSGFGFRKHPILKCAKMHEGLDFVGEEGDTIFATAPGFVTVAEYNRNKSSFGLHVKVRHDETYETLYAHMSKLFVKVDRQVDVGDPIGIIGNTGRSTGRHLHYEIHKHGKPVDPDDYILEKVEVPK